MQHESKPPPRRGPGGGEITKRANASLSIYPSANAIASATNAVPPFRNDNRPGAIPAPLLRAAISWLYVAGLISESVHDAAWKKLEGFA
jgi:hypothetical protein